MVTIHFKLQDIKSIQIAIDGPQTFAAILQHCLPNTGFEPDGLIAVRNNRIISKADWVEDLDEIDVFPALSGG